MTNKPGSFCWVELGTTDQNAAKSFYGSLFGWQFEDHPMGPSGVYTIFKLNGREVAAGYKLNPEMQQHGVPPHWMLYIAAESADQKAARVKELGGKIEAGPFDVMDFGRMAVVQDPTGAHFSIWQEKASHNNPIFNVDNALCWADLNTPDPEKARRFYSDLFGWKMHKDNDDPSGYIHIQNGDDFIGGVPPAKFNKPGAPPHWLLYFQVSEVDATAGKAKQSGAKFYLEPMSMENVGRLAVLADPQGAAFAIFKSARK